MTDSALKTASASPASPTALEDRQDHESRQIHKVVAFTYPSMTTGPQSNGRIGTAPLRDWSSAIDLIQEASEAIRISEERSSELEAQLNQVTAQAAEEMKRLHGLVASGEQRLARSEERLKAAEARAVEAEAWLVRMHDAVLTAFSSVQTGGLRRTGSSAGTPELTADQAD